MNNLIRPAWHVFSLIAVVLFLLLSYSNTFHASWHLDDLPNITDNSQLHINALNLSEAKKAITANPMRGKEGSVYRPVPMLSFAINWHIGKNNPFSYHIVNIAIHILSATFLYLTLCQLLTKTPYAQRRNVDARQAIFTALLATLLWSLHPIQTQAVTYIVQRMASMAAMFYIMAIFFYLTARTGANRLLKTTCYLFSSLCFLLAIGSKENALTIPFAIMLLEILFFQDLKQKKTRNHLVILFLSTLLLSALIGSVLFLQGNPLSFLDHYTARSFTLTERLLTEPRIVVRYLYQLFYPVTSNLSLDQDIVLSQSFFKPWTTIASLSFLSILFTSSLFAITRAPIFTFAVLFFFLNHILESSFIALELAFEHRNYLPSMFLFVPIAQVLVSRFIDFKTTSPIIAHSILLFSIVLILCLGFGTFSRNSVWITEETLWEDTLRKAPNSSRAAHNLGRLYRERGNFAEALRLFKLAEKNADSSAWPKLTMANALNGQASIYFYTDSPEMAIETFTKSLEVFPMFEASRKNLVLTLMKIQQWSKALEQSKVLVTQYPNVPEYLNIHAVALLRNNQIKQCIEFVKKAEKAEHGNNDLLLTYASVFKVSGDYEKALEYLYRYDKLAPGKLSVGLALLEINILQKNFETAEKLKQQIRSAYSIETIQKKAKENWFTPLFSQDTINNVIQ